MVETRSKRKPDSSSELPKPPPKKVAKKEKAPPASSVKKEEAVKQPKGKTPVVGDVISLENFGGNIQTHEGKSVTLKSLVDASKAGVILFTYPKASTPGCTRQACLFRDKKDNVTSTGLTIYGLSTDSPSANTNFKTKQSLNYELLCDPSRSLISAIGLTAEGNKTKRGVFAIDKDGKVLLSQKGGPEETVRLVEELVKA